MRTYKPSVAELLTASGILDFTPDWVARASQVLYGNVGANLDERNWALLMNSANPLLAAELSLKQQWQNPSYLLRNANHIVQNGAPEFAPEFTYRQMAQRLSYQYDSNWSTNTTFSVISRLGDGSLADLARSYEVQLQTPIIGAALTGLGVSLSTNFGGVLRYSVSGDPATIGPGSHPLVAAGAGGVVREGIASVTRDNGFAGTSGFYVLVGTDSALSRSFTAAGTPALNRLIVLGAGNDLVSAGQGNDTVFGGGGNDTIAGNQGEDLIYGGTGNDSIQGGQGNDTLDGGAGVDVIWGGSIGQDRLTGGADTDTFRFVGTNESVVVVDFTPADNEVISLAKGSGAAGSGSAAFSTIPGPNDGPLVAADFDSVTTISLVRGDTGGVNAGSNQVYLITTAQGTEMIMAAVAGGATNAFVLVFNSSVGAAQLVFDHDWSDAAGRTVVATFNGLGLADLQGLTLANFAAWWP